MAKKDKNTPAEDEAMSNGAEGGAEDQTPKKGGGILKLVLIVVLAMAVGGGGAFAAMKIFSKKTPAATEAKTEAHGEAVSESAAAEKTPAEVAKAPAEGEAPLTNPPKAGPEGEAAPAGEHGAPPAGEHGAAAEGGKPVEPAGPQNIEFKPFVVNLNDGSGRRFLKLTMSMQAETPEMANEINTKMPQFRDTILLLLSSLSYDDIATLDGKMRLRSQILNRINTQLSSGKVKNIYFSDFVIQ